MFLGRSIHRIYESAKENNYLKNLNNIVSEKESRSISEDNLVIVCTGSQGETNAALSRLVNDKNRFIEIFKKTYFMIRYDAKLYTLLNF